MRNNYDYETDLPKECEVCGVTLSPMQAEDSYHSTFEIGGQDGMILCSKHLDEETR